MKPTIDICSSHGILTADKASGRIIEVKAEQYDPHEPGELDPYVWFDKEEWLKYHRAQELPDALDILDCRLLRRDGVFEEAEDQWRLERRLCRAEALVQEIYPALRSMEIARVDTTPHALSIKKWLDHVPPHLRFH